MGSLGVNVLPDVMVHKLRFKIATAIVKVKKVRKCPTLASIAISTPYIRSILLSYPNRVVITMYIPVDADIGEFSRGDRLDTDVYTHDYIVRSKPLPKYLFIAVRGLIDEILRESNFNMCIENPLPLYNDWGKKPRISSLALHTLDILSMDPGLTVEEVKEEVSRRLGKEASLNKVKKYVKSASRFIYGYRISMTKAPYVSDVKLCVIVKNLRDATSFCLSIVRHPLVLGCSWNSLNEALVYISLPEVGLAMFNEVLYWFIDQFGGEVVDSFEYIVHLNYSAVVNLPYTEWSPLLKSWKKFVDLDIISYVIGKLKQSNCIDA